MKKFISLLLATSMAFAVPVFADTEGQSYAEVYAEKAKELFGITDTNYEYNFNKYDDLYSYTLTWDNCSISFDTKGNVSSFSKWKTGNRGSTKDQITREQAIEFGNKYLKKLLGENADKMKLESCDLKPNQCELYYCQYIGDYKAKYNTATIQVNNFGDLLDYDCDNMFDVDVEKADNILDYETAKKKYIENIGFGKAIESYYDYKTRTRCPFPCFTKIGFDYSHINASTGEKIAPFVSTHYKVGAGGGSSNEAFSDSKQLENQLTDAEKETVDNIKSVLSIEKAVEIVNNKFNCNIPTEDLKASYYSRDGKYYTSIYNSKNNKYVANVTSDGQIISFSYKDEENEQDKTLSSSELDEKVLQCVNSLNYNDYKINYRKEYKDYTAYTLYKYVDNIINFNDYIRVNIDTNGSITYFYFSNSNLEVPKFESSLSIEEAFDKCADAFGFTLSYILTDENKATLAYSFDNFPHLSPEGNPITSTNEEYVPKYNNGYTDIDDSPQKEYIEKLADLGLKFNSAKFSPNSTLTYKELKDFWKTYYIIIKFNDDHILTKYDMAKIFCNVLKLDDLCQRSKGYGSSYSDVYGENLPYVALCESLGIFSGGTEFNGNSPITRGEFAQLLYNFIDIYYNYTGNSLL